MLTAEDLRPIPIFASIPTDALHDIALVAADMRLMDGEYAYNEGDEAGFFVVISGRLEVIKIIDGHERKLGERAPGQPLGEVPLTFATRFPSAGRAVEQSRVLHLNARAFHDLAKAQPEFGAAVRALAQDRIGGLQGIAAEPFRAQATAVGDPLDDASVALRRFLERNHITYDWIAPDAPDRDRRWPGEPLVHADLPAILCADGTTLRRPPIRLIADKLGLQTSPRHGLYDTVIIGGGPAGLAAAVYGASEGLRTVVIEREAPGGQAGTSSRIENYLGFPSGISGDELADRAHRQARRLGAEILMTRQTVALDPTGPTLSVMLDGGETVRAHTAIIATGVSWRRVPIEGFDRFVGKGVYYGTARTDARIAQGADVHLIGAGNSAGQAAMFMSNHARSVTMVVRGDALEKSMSQYLVDQIRTKSNIRVSLRSEVTAVRGDTKLTEVDIHDAESGTTRTESSGGVFVFIGADAETGWLPDDLERDPRSYILTGTSLPKGSTRYQHRDPYLLETSVPGVFACGDVRFGPVKRVAAAVGEGSMAIAFIHQYLSTLPKRQASTGTP
jgi:thioredoxin reductase (NADPH)